MKTGTVKPKTRKLVLAGSVLILLGGGTVFLMPVALRVLVGLVWVGVDDVQTGLKQGVSLSSAGDCPITLPPSATDIHYAYELYWQGGCSVCRYTFPSGDLRKEGERHWKKPATWIRLEAGVTANVPEHRFAKYKWFQPTSIAVGWESDTSGVLWEPKVWVDETNRYIYVIEQN